MTALDSVVAPVHRLHGLHRGLAAQDDLRPCPQVDALFGELVHLVVTAPVGGAQLLADPHTQELRPELRHLCAEGEYQLELAWSRRIAAAADPRAALAAFPYLGNYRRLSRLELDALARGATRPARRVAFVGSGPLPLSSLLLAEALGVGVDNLDRDAGAVEAGRRVAAALGADALRFHRVDVLDADLGAYDVVVLAALVGATRDDKRAVLAHLAGSMAAGATLVARSARAARTLLYPALDRRDLAGFELQAVVHPTCDVVNSVVVARAPGHLPGRAPGGS